jgi:hypothetical protein
MLGKRGAAATSAPGIRQQCPTQEDALERLKMPLQLAAAYALLAGLTLLSRTLVKIVFGYTIIDRGMMLVLAGAFLGLGVIVSAIARAPEKYGDLAPAVALSLAVSLAALVVAWAGQLLTTRNVLAPVIIDAALIVWIWSARPKAHRR